MYANVIIIKICCVLQKILIKITTNSQKYDGYSCQICLIYSLLNFVLKFQRFLLKFVKIIEIFGLFIVLFFSFYFILLHSFGKTLLEEGIVSNRGEFVPFLNKTNKILYIFFIVLTRMQNVFFFCLFSLMYIYKNCFQLHFKYYFFHNYKK